MRLYRGLKEPYHPDRVGNDEERARGACPTTNFTDCPFTALEYARARRGTVLVVDIPDGATRPRVSEELWLGMRARRLMVWGRFDDFILAEIPAKELRAEVRRKGIAAQSPEYKSAILRDRIARRLSGQPRECVPWLARV